MLQNYNKWRILGIFFNDPLPEGGGFQLREIGRKAKLAPTSVKNYLKKLKAEGLIRESKHRAQGFPIYSANRENEKYIFYKKLNTLTLVFESGLISYLNDLCMPGAIVLFGSAAKGEDTIESDLDLFMLCKKREAELHRFEKVIGRRISLFFTENFSELSSELKNNIINGIRLNGYLKVF
ncbi:nucleotidyltransferase domain-containing protein [Candidatus Woesearchaeota archaeon]|nr:nucleotidyltransferase domain-containing protein [Candidatus Woesearchaeota archaeon]